jgi:hypothetical protein
MGPARDRHPPHPGIQPADVLELLDAGATVVVLAQGMQGQLQVMSETLALLAERGVPVHVADTEQAVQRYNELAATDPVGGCSNPLAERRTRTAERKTTEKVSPWSHKSYGCTGSRRVDRGASAEVAQPTLDVRPRPQSG